MYKDLVFIVAFLGFSLALIYKLGDAEYRRGYKAGKKAGIKQEREHIAMQKEVYPEMFEGDENGNV